MAQPQIKLTYFNGPGRAELARLAFHCGGVSFTDERIDHAKFAELKPTLPLGQVPVLEVDGVVYSQSIAIARYAAKLAGLYPSAPADAMRVDMIIDSVQELGPALTDILFREKDEAAKAEKTKKFVEETAPKTLAALEKMVQGKFFLGDEVTLADLQLLDIVAYKLSSFAGFSLDAYPKLTAVLANVKAIPNIAAYIAK